MSFKPFGFTFTPPKTIPSPPPSSSTTLSTGAGGTTSGSSSLAGQLISKLNNLTAMSQYLQDAIVARTRATAVEIDPSVDPVTSRALSSIYSTDTPPRFITVSMYDQLLDAHLGILQLEMAVGKDSPVQANPIQMADLMTVTKTVESHLIDSASYNTWLPLQLSSLKGDSVVFQSWAESLKTYPAFYSTQPLVPEDFTPSTIHASDLDLTEGIYNYENGVVDHFGRSYSSLYQAMASTHAVEQDINSVMLEYFYQPLQNILRIVSLFNALKGFAYKTSMENLQGDITNYTFVRLASDMTGMLHSADQLVSLAVQPLSGTLGSLGRIVAGVQRQAAEVGYLTQGGLAGLSKANACAQGNPYNRTGPTKPLTIPGLGTVSAGLKYLGEKLDWSFREANKGLSLVDKSFRQLLERRMKQQDDRNELMCSIRALDALLGIANGVATETQKGTLTSSASPQQQQDVVNRILTSLQTNSNTTFVAQGDQIVANPPDMPPAPKPVVDVLRGAKIRTTLGNSSL